MPADSSDPFAPSAPHASAAGPSRTAAPRQVLVAQTNDVRQFARLLRGIGMKHMAVMTISEAGFEVCVEEVRTFCAIAFIPNNLFQTFEYNPPPTPSNNNNEPTVFEISLDALLQCLNIFGNAGASGAGASLNMGKSKRRWAGEGDGIGVGIGGDDNSVEVSNIGGKKVKRTGMRMTWGGEGFPLSIFLQDEGRGPITTCDLSTYEPEELMNQAFDHDARQLYIILKSEWFRDALSDLPPSCTKMTFLATPRNDEPPDMIPDATASSNHRRMNRSKLGSFTILAEGDFGTAELDYPNDKELMDRFECEREIAFSYHSSHIALLGRALAQSIKIALMIEDSGFLCVQVMMPISGKLEVGEHQGILEFKMHALEDDE